MSPLQDLINLLTRAIVRYYTEVNKELTNKKEEEEKIIRQLQTQDRKTISLSLRTIINSPKITSTRLTLLNYLFDTINALSTYVENEIVLSDHDIKLVQDNLFLLVDTLHKLSNISDTQKFTIKYGNNKHVELYGFQRGVHAGYQPGKAGTILKELILTRFPPAKNNESYVKQIVAEKCNAHNYQFSKGKKEELSDLLEQSRKENQELAARLKQSETGKSTLEEKVTLLNTRNDELTISLDAATTTIEGMQAEQKRAISGLRAQLNSANRQIRNFQNELGREQWSNQRANSPSRQVNNMFTERQRHQDKRQIVREVREDVPAPRGPSNTLSDALFGFAESMIYPQRMGP